MSIHELASMHEEADFTRDHHRCLIFFGSVACGHCRDIKPFIEDMVREYPDVAFAHVEVSAVKVENVAGVPTFVFYVQGQASFMTIGGVKSEIKSHLDEIMKY